jgi:PIN domain nuclease of toxin-antitoxin system
MKLMLDTHVLIWWLDDDPRLSGGARAVLADPRHSLIMSIASFWEMAIKFRQRKLQISGTTAYRAAMRQQVSVVGISRDHLLALEALPERANHKDPFDRLILAQALSEDMALMTGDRQMLGYGVTCVGIG